MAPRILITNDDGINAPGIRALASMLSAVGDVYIVAPTGERSAAAHSITFNHPLRVNFINKREASVEGTPTDCVMFGYYGFMKKARPDLLVSGINNGPNLGDDITYSGTVSAALEGTLLGIPSIAVSMGSRIDPKYRSGAVFLKALCSKVLAEGLPKNTFLNVNIPNVERARIKGIKVCRQGKRVYRDMFLKRIDPRGRTYYWLGGKEPSALVESGTDFEAIKNNRISVTPLHFDLTNHPAVAGLKFIENLRR